MFISHTHEGILVLLAQRASSSIVKHYCVCVPTSGPKDMCVLTTQHLPVCVCTKTSECSVAVYGKLCRRETGRCTLLWRSSGDNSGQRWVIHHRDLKLLSHALTHTLSLTHTHTLPYTFHKIQYSAKPLSQPEVDTVLWKSIGLLPDFLDSDHQTNFKRTER